VQTTDDLLAWATAHGGGATFHPALLDNPAVVILTARDKGDLVAGVIGNRSESVVGLSNLLIGEVDLGQVWAEASEALGAQFPGLPMVGYEDGTNLRAAHHAGFVSVGPLRVWLNDSSARATRISRWTTNGTTSGSAVRQSATRREDQFGDQPRALSCRCDRVNTGTASLPVTRRISNLSS
jgi:hypothetical protein